MPEHTSHHVIRIDRTSYPSLRAAVTQRQLTPSQEKLTVMHSGEVYQPAAPLLAAQVLRHDRCLNLGPLQLAGEFYRVPEQEYTSLITVSAGSYRQYPGADTLLTDLLSPMTPAAETRWWQRVREAVAQGRQPTAGVDLVDDTWVPTAWLTQRTRLVQLGREWFAVLFFAQPDRQPASRSHQVIGVDVGLRPLATATWRQYHEVTYAVHEPALPAGAPDEVAAFAQILEYAAARAALEALTILVLSQAGQLVLEALDYASFASAFPADARRRAVADWHQSWAPQRAYSRGIRVTRVRAAFSSQVCSQCRRHTPGVRQGQEFRCPHGHHQNAHVNAARNLVRRYWAQQRRARSHAGAGG